MRAREGRVAGNEMGKSSWQGKDGEERLVRRRGVE